MTASRFYLSNHILVSGIQGEGRYEDAAMAKKRRAAICIGPEHGTIGPELIKEAAKEAVQGVGFDLLLILGFAFDPHVAEEAKRYGKLTVLPVRLNPDLMMGKLLRQTKAANLFMVFGEPDIEIKKLKNGQITATIHGLDLYDPNTGEIRSSSSDEIACWFLDTNYNGESFFVRHAYFTGANEPYEKLKRALRAEIDEAAWSALYKTTSRLFPAPKSGKLAVKVINHYGDESIEKGLRGQIALARSMDRGCRQGQTSKILTSNRTSKGGGVLHLYQEFSPPRAFRAASRFASRNLAARLPVRTRVGRTRYRRPDSGRGTTRCHYPKTVLPGAEQKLLAQEKGERKRVPEKKIARVKSAV